MSSLEELVPNLLANPHIDEVHRRGLKEVLNPSDSVGSRRLDALEAMLPHGYKVYVHSIERKVISMYNGASDTTVKKQDIQWGAYLYMPDMPVVLGNVFFKFVMDKGIDPTHYDPEAQKCNHWEWIIKSKNIHKVRGARFERTTANFDRAMAIIRESCIPQKMEHYAYDTLRWVGKVERSMANQNACLEDEFKRAVKGLSTDFPDQFHYQMCKTLLDGKPASDLEGAAGDRYTKAMERVIRAYDEKADLHKEGNTEVYFVYIAREPYERLHTVEFEYLNSLGDLALGDERLRSRHVVYDNPEDIPDFICNACAALDLTPVAEDQGFMGRSEQWVDRLGVRMASDIYFVCRP